MTTQWHGTFRDRYGTEDVTIGNDGSKMHLTIRGVKFTGGEDSLAPEAGAPVPVKLFDSWHGELCSYTLTWSMPVQVLAQGRQVDGTLDCSLRLGDPGPFTGGGLDAVELHLGLRYADVHVKSPRPHGFWDGALDELHCHLPPGVFIRGCLTCAWADRSLTGAGLNSLARCRNPVQDALQAGSATRQISDWPWVQATWLCPQYEVQTSQAPTGPRRRFEPADIKRSAES